MKLRATSRGRDLRSYPLDSTDVFLLSLLEDELTPEELADVSVCDSEETSRRVQALARFGLVQIAGSGAMHLAVATPENDNSVDSRTVPTLPPPEDFSAESLFGDLDLDAEEPEGHVERRNTLPFVRAKRST
jgi:hypothetical protein